MIDHYYPPLKAEKDFLLVSKLLKTHPDYFTNPACPYSDGFKALFTSPDVTKGESNGLPREETTLGGIQDRIERLVEELDDYGREDGRSSADKNTYFRLSVTLVKELIDMKKEVSLMIEHEAFVNEILAILDEVCDADQRAAVQVRMKRFIGEKDAE